MNRGEMPYEYYIVEYENRNRQEYLTVSKRGVTFHTGGEGDFYTREMLLREIKLYNRIKLIPFYQNYLIVKTLKVWKNAMLKRRFDTASQSLEKGLHNLAPHSNQYMSMVGNFLYELSHINFLESRISKTMELSEFTKLLKK
jgi:endonuclease I